MRTPKNKTKKLGRYTSEPRFGDNTRGSTFGSGKASKIGTRTPGPGEYESDR